jgi:hypothetical protein
MQLSPILLVLAAAAALAAPAPLGELAERTLEVLARIEDRGSGNDKGADWKRGMMHAREW